MDSFNVTLVPEDDPRAQCLLIEVEGTQPLSSNLVNSEQLSYVCSFCKQEFNTEERYDSHVEMKHKELMKDDKNALKMTSELTAALSAVCKEIPEIMDTPEKEALKEGVPVLEAAKTKQEDEIEIIKHIKGTEANLDSKCYQCKYQTKSERSMKMHIKNSHAALHKHTCDKCNFKTSSQPMLKDHIRTVHREQLIKCGECQKEFKTRMELIVHKKLHKSQYPCKLCNYKSTSERCLKIHINKIHSVVFKCDFCQFKGKSNKSLLMHKQKSHISNSFTNIGSKRDHSMVPKNSTSNENSPPKKYKKPDDLKVVGSENWSKTKNETGINNKTDENQKAKQDENKRNKPTNITKKNEKIPPKSTLISNPMIKIMLAEIDKDDSDYFIRDVTGDGACGTRCLALHSCHNEDTFPKIRRDINKYIIHHWELLDLSGFYGKFEDEGGVTLNVGGYLKTFHSEIEFQCFLDSEEAGLLWIDQIDLQMAANTYNIDINVLSVELEAPKWTHISPDTRLKDHTCGVCEVIKYNMEIPRELLLLHTANHYKLFVPKQSPLADTLGYVASEEKEQELEQKEQEVTPSLRLGTMSNSVGGDRGVDHMELQVGVQEEQAKDLSEVEELKKLVLNLKNENIKLRQKLESKDLTSCNICGKRLANEKDLNNHIQEHNESADRNPWLKPNYTNTRTKPVVQQQSPAKEKHVRFSEIWNCDQCENIFNTKQLLEAHVKNKHKKDAEIVLLPDNTLECNTCAFVSDTKTELEIHKKENHRKEKEYTCNDCDFQATSQPILRKHRQLVHNKVAETEPTPTDEIEVDEVEHEEEKSKKCQLCEEKFISKNNLAQHRREQHPTYQPCRNMSQCKYNIDCFYSHIPIPEGRSRCFQCGDEFGSQKEMMFHRRETHPESVKTCRKFLTNQCSKTEGCWWLHKMTDFQQIPIYPAPPDKKQVWSSLQTSQQPNQQTINQTIMSMIQTVQESMNMMMIMIQQHTNKQPNQPQNQTLH